MRKASYRLGRRLKSSAKARRDYITYLNTNRPLIVTTGPLKVRFGGGGFFVVNLSVEAPE